MKPVTRTLPPDKTLADYLAIAIAPALIMVLVGSLAFFLKTVLYDGEHQARLSWVIFWFVLAIVGVARIAIERSVTHASVYGLLLAWATSMFMFRFVDQLGVTILLLAVIWWCANRLVWDCTLINEDEDASGEGLLKIARVDDVTQQNERRLEDRSVRRRSAAEWGKRVLTWLIAHPMERKDEPHAPGLWVVYFSMAALPVFGVGQLFLPLEDRAERDQALVYLLAYVASGFLLLLVTSFLGLRRYLRQRRLEMPAGMAVGWVSRGLLIAAGVAAVAFLLPRPDGRSMAPDGSNPGSDLAVRSDDRGFFEGASSSDAGNGREGRSGDPSAAPDPGGEGHERSPDARTGGAAHDGQGPAESGPTENGQADRESPSSSESSEGRSQAGSDSEPRSELSAEERAVALSERFSHSEVMEWFHRLRYVPGLVLLVYVLLRFGGPLLEWISSGLGGLISRVGRQGRRAPSGGVAPHRARSAAGMADPFADGRAPGLSDAELVQLTFERLREWGTAHGCEPRPEQTPVEFAKRVIEMLPDAELEIRELTRSFTALNYGATGVRQQDRAGLQSLWRRISA